MIPFGDKINILVPCLASIFNPVMIMFLAKAVLSVFYIPYYFCLFSFLIIYSFLYSLVSFIVSVLFSL